MNRIVLWSVLAATILVLGGQSEADPVEWSVAAGGNGHFYEPVLSTGTWDTAKTAAEAMGVLTKGYLATITSAEENAFVYGLVSNPVYWLVTTDARGPWLGGYQTTEAGGPAANWRWVTGETWSYTNWDSGQPNNYGGGIQVRTACISSTEMLLSRIPPGMIPCTVIRRRVTSLSITPTLSPRLRRGFSISSG